MTIIYRHLIRTFIPPFFLGLSVTTFVLMIDVLSRYVDMFLEKGIRFTLVAEVLLLSLGHTFALSIPMAVLVGTLMSVGHLAADNEITALKATGVSLYQLARPLLLAGIVFTAGMVAYNHFVLPESNYRLKTHLVDISRLRPALSIKQNVFTDINDEYTIFVRDKDDKTGDLTDVVLYSRRGRGDPSPDVVVANSGLLRTVAPGRIELDLVDGEMHRLPDVEDPVTYQRTAFQRQTFAIDLGAQNIGGGKPERGEREMNVAMLNVAKAERLRLMGTKQEEALRSLNECVEAEAAAVQSLRDKLAQPRPETGNATAQASAVATSELLREYRATLSRFDQSARKLGLTAQRVQDHQVRANRFAVELHKKFSIPFACIVFVLLGLPLAVASSRSGRGVSVGMSLVVFLVYYLFLTGGEKLADRGLLNPFWSMWAPNFVLGIIGIALLYQAVQENRTFDANRFKRLLPRRWRSAENPA